MRGSTAVAGVIIVLLLLLPLFYVLGIGPLVWCYDRGLMSPRVASVCETIYWPLEWTGRRLPVAERALEAYVNCFRSPQPVPVNAPLPAPPVPPPPPATYGTAPPTVQTPSAAEEPDLSQPAICR